MWQRTSFHFGFPAGSEADRNRCAVCRAVSGPETQARGSPRGPFKSLRSCTALARSVSVRRPRCPLPSPRDERPGAPDGAPRRRSDARAQKAQASRISGAGCTRRRTHAVFPLRLLCCWHALVPRPHAPSSRRSQEVTATAASPGSLRIRECLDGGGSKRQGGWLLALLSSQGVQVAWGSRRPCLMARLQPCPTVTGLKSQPCPTVTASLLREETFAFNLLGAQETKPWVFISYKIM